MANQKVNYSLNMLPVFLVFLVLKLTHVVAWGWVWVCAPLWIPLGFVAAILTFVVVAIILAAIAKVFS